MTEAFQNRGSPGLEASNLNYGPRVSPPPPFATQEKSSDDEDAKHKPGNPRKDRRGHKCEGGRRANANLLQQLDPNSTELVTRELQLDRPGETQEEDRTYQFRSPGGRAPDLTPWEPSKPQDSSIELTDIARRTMKEFLGSPESRSRSLEPPQQPAKDESQPPVRVPSVKEEQGPLALPTSHSENDLSSSSSLSKYLIRAPEGSTQDSLPALRSPEATNSPDNGHHRLPPIKTQLGPLPPVPSSNAPSVRMSGAPPYSLPPPGAVGSPPLLRTDPGSWEHHRTIGPPKLPQGPFSHMSPANSKDLLLNSSPVSQTYASWSSTPKSTIHYLYDPPTSKSAASSYPTPAEQTPGGVCESTPFNSTPHSNGSTPTGTFKCSHPGCTAPPFQTQYLLNSHANVHSQDRPHFCAVEGCSRGPGGKGFKRKNEMIRHGLVHNSPGYVCPFCPDQQHKYPRPDNLQRHVRVHHVDKSKDDPALRHVLAQRPEGSTRGRRRRMNAQ